MLKAFQKINWYKSDHCISYRKFPLCFIAEGEAKPLKIGLFQDLAEALKDDERVSKLNCVKALRQYTSNWRYLHGCREGAERVDLYGNPAGVLDAEHVSHATQQLADAKAKICRKTQSRISSQKSTTKNALLVNQIQIKQLANQKPRK